jgi:predicted TIM-barrel fold metal-dependent hydrolase
MLSSDSHVMEPPDLWRGAPHQFADIAPRVEFGDDADWWIIDGQRMFSFSCATKAGVRFDDQQGLLVEYRFDEVRRGSHDPLAHLRDNEIDGVWGSVLYPSVGTMLYNLEDSAALDALAAMYNDWIAEWCATAPGRLKGVGILNVDDPSSAARELQRIRDRGLAGALIPVSTRDDEPYDHPRYEPLWTAAEALQMPLSLHIATNRTPDAWRILWTQWGFQGADRFVRDSLSQMIFGGVFERHPGLLVGSVEHEMAWLPHFAERIDYSYTQRTPRAPWHEFADGALPSHFIARNVFVSFIEDRPGVLARGEMATAMITWGSDYPHTESTFPRSRDIVDALLEGVDESERLALTFDNAARIYGFEQPNRSQRG